MLDRWWVVLMVIATVMSIVIMTICILRRKVSQPAIPTPLSAPDWRTMIQQDEHKDFFIPQQVCFTYDRLDRIPARIREHISHACGAIPHHVFDNDEAMQYLHNNFGNSVATMFSQLRGAHKADLFRYAYIYKEGGVYCDIKTKFTQPVLDMFPWTTPRAFCTVLSMIPGTIYQGILASYPGNPFLAMAMQEMMITPLELSTNLYLLFTAQLYDMLRNATATKELRPGWQELVLPNMLPVSLLLFLEDCMHAQCAQRDRYGLCCHIMDATCEPKTMVCETRHADFPWVMSA